jgi:hypothetical protein
VNAVTDPNDIFKGIRDRSNSGEVPCIEMKVRVFTSYG